MIIFVDLLLAFFEILCVDFFVDCLETFVEDVWSRPELSLKSSMIAPNENSPSTIHTTISVLELFIDIVAFV